jgi:hypothetical protein
MLITTVAFAQAVDEKIAGFNISLDQISFTVWNTGYTDKASFTLEAVKAGSVYEVKLIRIKQDYGKMMPQPMEITYTQAELKGKLDLRNPIKILNPFSVYNF